MSERKKKWNLPGAIIDLAFFDLAYQFFSSVMLFLMLSLAALTFWLTDKFNPNFATRVAQGQSGFTFVLYLVAF